MAKRRWLERWADWWFGQTEPLEMQLARHTLAHAKNVFPLNPPVKTGNPFAYADRMGLRKKGRTPMDKQPRDGTPEASARPSDLVVSHVTLTRQPPDPRTWARVTPGQPTVTQLADLLEQLTAEGMPPRLQARHVAFHWPGMVRKEDTP